ncbi:hypothetical protein RCO28_01045 [Streptomyces sp. LHD-70]|uniref:hypothetical protein n=1 Tax=Streptomyces sp. LHD-70 TaxID=3072140 RepID=UPI002810174E|nr:hypothetical protein [Streptomyces sp. LHD-70]MDQ8701077.1 hypothetical protein [Streptomyces sp. LHD-70]
MTYYEDVKFLEDCDPKLIERNAAEYKRMRDLLDSTEPSVRRAQDVEWTSESRAQYEDRLKDVKGLVQGLMDGYEAAWKALLDYADAVEEAKAKLRQGGDAQDLLSEVVSREAVPITRTAQEAEPMRRWEDVRSTTGFFDWFAELGVDADAIRDEANRYYEQADAAFSAALRAEQGPRAACVAALKRAKGLIPDFRTDNKDAAALLDKVKALSHEKVESADNPLTRLPGSTEDKGSLPTVDGERVSPLLQDLRNNRKSMPDVSSMWLTDATGDKKEWIAENKEAIKEAARAYGLPPDMVAGIAWIEVGGKPYAADNMTGWAREAAESSWSPVTPDYLPGPLAGDKDNTSYGPMAVQVRRAAEVLGYDPENLTDGQRDELKTALQDPSQNMLISAKYMADLKAQSSFADVPADQMTPEQYRELAARYNGGPYWQGSDAQNYGTRFEGNRAAANEALR